MKKTLIIFIDALRPNYINKTNTPHLYNLKKENTYLNLISLLGYSSGIHPTIWTGKYQEKHGKFLVYSYDPKNSPFKWMSILKYCPEKIKQYIIGSLKAPYYLLPINKGLYPKWYKKKILPTPASIEPKYAKYFKIEDYNYDLTFFNILKKENIPYSSQPDYYNENYGEGVGLKNWKVTNKALDYYFSYDLDGFGHYPGPNSNELKKALKNIDTKIGELINTSKKKYKDFNFFIFSDHGMEEITQTINVKNHLKKINLKPEKDYIIFYDSTMVRFWCTDETIKKKIISHMKKLPNITHLDSTLKKKYHINFKNRKWGDLFFLADNGFRIFPDNFAPVKFNTKGMHGYFPEKNENAKGIFLTNTFKTSANEIKIIDLFPTLLKNIGLEKKIPKDIDGKPLK